MRSLGTIVLLPSVFILSLLLGGCAATLRDPVGPNSSLVIGRVIINNKYPGRLGLMPLGTIRRGIALEIKNKDQTLLITAVTQPGGYFVIPNIPPNAYFLSRVIFKGGTPGDEETMYLRGNTRAFFVPVPGQVVDLGTFQLDISDGAEVTPNYQRPDAASSRAYLERRHGKTPWLKRKFNP